MGRAARAKELRRREEKPTTNAERATRASKCPDFNYLEPLTSLPRRLCLTKPEDPLSGLMLCLALAYNDLKGISWMDRQLIKCMPDDAAAITPESGQWNGMRIQAARYAFAIGHEILELLKRATAKKHLRSEGYLRVLAKVDPAALPAWRELVRLATTPDAPNPLRKYLNMIRNTAAFHYDPKILKRGYAIAFSAENQTPQAKYAYVSTGKTLAGTRWYFADAAVVRTYVADELGGKMFEDADDFMLRVRTALSGILEAWIAIRCEEIKDPES